MKRTTLLSVPGKITCNIILECIKKLTDLLLREIVEGFRPLTSCADSVALRHIIEPSVAWKAPFVLNAIDFQKGFDSIHRESLWTIVTYYGIPVKIIRIIKNLCDNITCTISDGGNISQWFAVTTGVSQDCIMSPLFFVLVIDYFIRKITAEGTEEFYGQIIKHN